MKQTDHTYQISAATLAALHKEVNSLGSVILSKPLLPILENFLLKIEHNQIVLAASDQQTSIVSRIPLEGENSAEPLQIAVPARMLRETLKNLPKQPIALSIDKERYNITLRTSNGQYKIACESADDFPNVFAFPEGEVDITLRANVLQRAIKKTIFTVSKDELRPELSGIFVSLKKDGLIFVATDGHRLASYKRKDITAPKEVACIVPAKSLQLLLQLIGNLSDKKINLVFKEKQLFVSWDDIQFIISLINESYPDYKNVIPLNNPYRLTLNTDCLPTLRRIGIYVNLASQQLRFHIQKDRIELVAEDLDFSNTARETIPCQYEGPSIDIGFNAKLLIEMMGILPLQTDIQLRLDTPNKAVLIEQPVHGPEEEICMLIMPILLNA